VRGQIQLRAVSKGRPKNKEKKKIELAIANELSMTNNLCMAYTLNHRGKQVTGELKVPANLSANELANTSLASVFKEMAEEEEAAKQEQLTRDNDRTMGADQIRATSRREDQDQTFDVHRNGKQSRT
jgi:hypothetical protein